MSINDLINSRSMTYAEKLAQDIVFKMKIEAPEVYQNFIIKLEMEDQIKNIIKTSCAMGYRECYRNLTDEIY